MSSVATPVRSLDARYYTDPAVFRVEFEGLFKRTWQFAGHTSRSKTLEMIHLHDGR